MEDSGYTSSSNSLTGSGKIIPGKLKRMVLKNFMCHDHFEINLNPSVNFITGHNGSGKSAIASALILGFGQRATITSRGVAARYFIKRGKQSAIIEITLHNIGNDNTYKFSKFGIEIAVIRRILCTGESIYKIKGETCPEEKLSHEDLDSILMHFNIQPNNPLCILSQESARNFFKSCDPKQMFQLFMNGTQLETIRSQYQKHKKSLLNLSKENKKAQQELKKMFEDIIEADRKNQLVEKLKAHEAKKQLLEKEQAWSSVTYWKSQYEAKLKEVEAAETENMNIQSQLENRNENIFLDKKKELEEVIRTNGSEIETVELELMENIKLIQKESDILKGKTRSLYNCNMKINEDKESIEKLNSAINNFSGDSDFRMYKEQLSTISHEIKEINAMLKNTDIDVKQLNDTITERTNSLENHTAELRNCSKKIESIDRKLIQLQEGKSLVLYGHWMPELVERIEAAHKRGMFKEKPCGPLGSYIKVLNPDWVPALNVVLGSYLSVFCVSCTDDNKVLNTIFNKTFFGQSRKPDIIIGKFTHSIYNTSEKEVRTDMYSSLLRCLEISDPVVANCLIDHLSIEHILLVPTIEAALHLTEKRNNVPRNLKVVITLDADYIYPAPNYRFYAGQFKKGGTNLLQTDISLQKRDLENVANTVKTKTRQLLQGKSDIIKEINSLKVTCDKKSMDRNDLKRKLSASMDKKSELERNPPMEPGSIEVFRSEMVEITTRKIEMEERSEVIKREIQNMNNQIKDYKCIKCNLEQQKLVLIDKDKQVKNELQGLEKSINDCIKKNHESKNKAALRLKRINKLKSDSEALNEKLSSNLSKASKLGDAIEVNRKTEEINDELKEVVNYIKTFEKEIGGATQQIVEDYHLKKRMYNKKERTIDQLKHCIKKTESSIMQNLQNYNKANIYFMRQAKLTFRNMMLVGNFKGSLEFDCTESKLHVKACPDITGNDNTKPAVLNSLSGGERSYSTIAFIKAIWSCMTSPFYVMDEFDVFTDISNRMRIIQFLIQHATKNDHFQYLFITPLDLRRIETDRTVSIFDISKQTSSQ